jgi:nickel/cobalt exporter
MLKPMKIVWRILQLFLAGSFLLLASPVAAHPLNPHAHQWSYLLVDSEGISLNLEIRANTLAAHKLLADADANGDMQLTEAEKEAWAQRTMETLLIKIDDEAVAWELEEVIIPARDKFTIGLEPVSLRLRVQTGPLPGVHRLEYANHTYSDWQNSYWYEIQSERSAGIDILGQCNNEQANRFLAVYGQGEVSEETRAWLEKGCSAEEKGSEEDFSPSISGAYQGRNLPCVLPPGPAEKVTPQRQAPSQLQSMAQKKLGSILQESDSSLSFLIVALAVAVVLGALHSLTPGHSQVFVAAYLVGARGTVGHAALLGGVVTLAHTINVTVLSLVMMVAARYFVPQKVVPYIKIAAALLLVILCLNHLAEHFEGGPQVCSHGHHDHRRDRGGISLRDIFLLAISGSLVPCPTEMAIMLVAVDLKKILLGLALIVAFSFGLGVLMIAVSVLMVTSKSFLAKMSGFDHLAQRLPLLSGLAGIVLGLGIMIKALISVGLVRW